MIYDCILAVLLLRVCLIITIYGHICIKIRSEIMDLDDDSYLTILPPCTHCTLLPGNLTKVSRMALENKLIQASKLL